MKIVLSKGEMLTSVCQNDMLTDEDTLSLQTYIASLKSILDVIFTCNMRTRITCNKLLLYTVCNRTRLGWLLYYSSSRVIVFASCTHMIWAGCVSGCTLLGSLWSLIQGVIIKWLYYLTRILMACHFKKKKSLLNHTTKHCMSACNSGWNTEPECFSTTSRHEPRWEKNMQLTREVHFGLLFWIMSSLLECSPVSISSNSGRKRAWGFHMFIIFLKRFISVGQSSHTCPVLFIDKICSVPKQLVLKWGHGSECVIFKPAS